MKSLSRFMATGVIATLAITGLAGTLVSLSAAPPAMTAERCQALTGLRIADTTISSAALVSAGATVDGDTKASSEICRVVGVIKPTPRSNINFEVWLPRSGWTGRLEQVGNGGFAGTIMYSRMAAALEKNNAVAATDDGTSQPADAPPGQVLMGNEEALKDLSFRAVHVTNIAARDIVKAFYGRGPAYAYFNGCSRGGAEALVSAQRYPEDFDGILAGNPGPNQLGMVAGMTWASMVAGDPARPGYVPASYLPLLQKAALEQCSSAKLLPDDRFFTDPSKCKINVEKLQCTGAQDGTCLSRAQVESVKAVLRGPVTSTGTLLAAPLAPEFNGWADFVVPGKGPPYGRLAGESFYRAFVATPMTIGEPQDFLDTTAVEALRQRASIINVDNPDLRGFAARGGKMIQYHGWADGLIPPGQSVDYFQAVTAFHKAQGSKGGVQDYLRLFMVPGLGHCFGGDGLTAFGQEKGSGEPGTDIFAALVDWVEHGRAPTQIVAKGGSGADQFSRPVCTFPKWPTYLGGNPKDAASFACR